MLKCALVLAHRCSGIGAPYFAVTSRPLLAPATSFIHPSAKKCFAEKTEGRCRAVPKLFDIFVIKYLNASTDFVARASLDLRRCYGIQRCFGLWATLGSSWTLPHELRPYLGEDLGSVWVSKDYLWNALRTFVRGCNAAKADEVALPEISDR